MQNMNHETTAATARHTALPDTVALEGEELVIIDQTELPRRLKLLHLSERYEIFEAIKSLRVRGAPAIGVAAAIGLYIAAHRKLTQEPDITSSAMLGHIAEERDYLASSRPTAVNLFWALDRMYARAASRDNGGNACRSGSYTRSGHSLLSQDSRKRSVSPEARKRHSDPL